jgi:hypothetical protein
MSMGKSVDVTMLALLATLERRAKKSGEKSLVKSVVARLVAAGADRELIAKISTVRAKKIATADRTSSAKTSGKTKAAKSKLSESATVVA